MAAQMLANLRTCGAVICVVTVLRETESVSDSCMRPRMQEMLVSRERHVQAAAQKWAVGPTRKLQPTH